MPNKKLHQRLAARATKVLKLFASNRHTSAHSLGRSAYDLVKGSEGRTINPFIKGSFDAKEFRFGFRYQKKLSKEGKAA